MKKILRVLVNRETITYLIAGVATTLLNFIVYNVSFRLLAQTGITVGSKFDYTNLTAELIAVILAVVFAYVINARWVFQEKREPFRSEIRKIAKFFASRFVTMLIEVGGMLLFVDLLDCPAWILRLVDGAGILEKAVVAVDPKNLVKAVVAVIVIILNYLFSKLFVFTKKGKEVTDSCMK